jgi:hypothetical protein
MTQVILLSFLCIGMLPLNNQPGSDKVNMNIPVNSSIDDRNGFNIGYQADPENEKMLAVTFRNQGFCRVELKDFVFDVTFNVVSATVYFSGTNFKNVETGYISSKDLKPIRKLMDRCAPGTMVVFDNVKVLGPDNLVRTIQGTSYMLK